MLAKLHRAGELTAIWIPDAAYEGDSRPGAGASNGRGECLPDRIYRGPRAWTLAYRRWLTIVRFDHPAQQIVLQDYIHAVEDAEARRDRLTRQIE
jgi:transposase